MMVTKMRLWRSLTNQLEEIKEYDKKYKNFTSAKIDAVCLNVNEAEKNKLIEDMSVAEEDFIIVELPKNNNTFIF